MDDGGRGGGGAGRADSVLVVVRGPSGAGKSSVAARLRAAHGRGIAVVGQDVLRRTVLRERDSAGAANIGLIGLVARHALDHGFHVVVEGILAADHRGRTFLYYLDVGFEESVRRHAGRPQAAEFSAADMAAWYRPRDLLPGRLEHVVPQDSTLEETVERILADTGLAPPGHTPRP
ncbi:AAA family ATPase [Kitasatospora sp. NPDC008115]|uniref:AAA family ATPase n=1 Tax=Kitasatospora sp. NPDC008115 TaxID=3364022 RepID=UPI0036EAEFE9